jgi:hydroxymethylpyrimidine pyrophosphatase-like HAD family hydrolase
MAGWGVAMANADPKVKAVADEICESNNDAGVGKTILRLLGA